MRGEDWTERASDCAQAQYLSATYTQHAVFPPLAAAMASQFATMNSSAIIGEGAAHTSMPPDQSISIRPQRAPHAASTGPVVLHTIAIVLFFIPLLVRMVLGEHFVCVLVLG